MINKRLLVKNLLAHNDENSFYDKKRFISINQKEGKAKFLKHVCALANSNPNNNSFIVIGVEDEDNTIVGVDFFDDSKIQNLVNAYLDNPPLISYENIPFPHLEEGKVVGLVTIKSNGNICTLGKNIWKYYGGMVFFREGSISLPKAFDIELKDVNFQAVSTIQQHARNNIELTLDGVIDFINNRHKDLESNLPEDEKFHESRFTSLLGVYSSIYEYEYITSVWYNDRFNGLKKRTEKMELYFNEIENYFLEKYKIKITINAPFVEYGYLEIIEDQIIEDPDKN